MYFSKDLFIKKGPISSMWIAGTIIAKKLQRSSVMKENIEIMCNNLKSPPIPLALRAISTLLLGVTRIYERKVHFILMDAGETQAMLRILDKRSNVDLVNQITKPETINMPELNLEDIMADIDMQLLGFDEIAREETSSVFEEEPYYYIPALPGEFNVPRRGRSPSVSSFRVSEISDAIEQGQEIPALELEPLDYEMPDIDFGWEPPAVGIEAEDNESPEALLPKPTKVARKRKFLEISKNTQLTDNEIRTNLSDTSDITIERPNSIWPCRSIPSNLQLPISSRLFPPKHLIHFPASLSFTQLSTNLLKFYREKCKVEPIEEPAEIERELSPAEQFEMDQGERPEYEMPEYAPPEYAPLEEELDVEAARRSIAGRESFLGRRISELQTGIPMSAKRPSIAPFPEATLPVESMLEEEPATVKVNISSGTSIFLDVLKEKLAEVGPREAVLFNDAIYDPTLMKTTKRDAAFGFFQLLVLKTIDVVKTTQKEPYEDIEIRRGRKFTAGSLGSQLFATQRSQRYSNK